MLEQRSPGEDQAVFEETRVEVGSVLRGSAQADEVPADLPPDGLAQLLATAGELAVDRRPQEHPTLHTSSIVVAASPK